MKRYKVSELFVLELSRFPLGLSEYEHFLVLMVCNEVRELAVLLIVVRDKNHSICYCVWDLVRIRSN